MFDHILRPLIERPLNALADRLIKMNVKADEITWVGLMLSVAAGLAVLVNYHGLALIFFLLNRLADGLDGAVARATKPSAFGTYLDLTLDFMSYAILPFAFAVMMPDDRLAAAFLIGCFYISGGSFLAYEMLCAKHAPEGAMPKKHLVFLGSQMAGAETIFFFSMFCFWPASFGWGCWLFGLLCLVTAFGRIFAAHEHFKDKT